MGGLEVLGRITEQRTRTAVVMMTAFDDMQSTITAIKLGAFEYLVKPLNFIDLDLTMDKALQVRSLEDKVSYLVEEKQKGYTIDNIIGRSPQMRESAGSRTRRSKTWWRSAPAAAAF